MSILSQNLHQSILRALRIAGEHCHDRATPEHLLLALTDDPDAAPVMRACNVDLEQLRRIVSMSLPRSSESSKVPSSTVDPRPNASFQGIIQRAVRHIQSAEQNVVTGAHILVATFAEPVAQFLSEQGMTRYDAVSYVCHGIVKQLGPAAETGAISEAGAESENKANGPTYEVVLLNDEYTPMEFVVWVLQEVFYVTHENAVDIMLSVHKSGTGSCGFYSRVEAQNLARRVIELAREPQHPLRCVLRAAGRRPAGRRPYGLTRLVARAVTVLVPRDFLPNWFERKAGW
jgi:ATP-dependent Clp protease ATP-binding subunit ClpA